MISSETRVGLKPTWKGNLCLLLLAAMIASASIFALQYKMTTAKPLTFAVEAAHAYGHGVRHFRPPWSVEDLASRFVVKDREGKQLAYINYDDNPNKRSTLKLLSRDEARRMAAAIAKLLDGSRAN